MNERIVITPNDAAKMVATSPNNIYPLLENGTIPATRLFGDNWKIDKDEFKRWFSDMCKAEAEERRQKCHRG